MTFQLVVFLSQSGPCGQPMKVPHVIRVPAVATHLVPALLPEALSLGSVPTELPTFAPGDFRNPLRSPSPVFLKTMNKVSSEQVSTTKIQNTKRPGLTVASNTVFSANKEMGSTDESHSHTDYEPKDCYHMETYVESLRESLTQPQFSEQRFLEDVDHDDTALEEMLHNAHRVHVFHSQREGLCVGRSSVSE